MIKEKPCRIGCHWQHCILLTKIQRFYLMYPVFRDVKASGLYFLVYSYTLDKLRVGEPSRENTGPEIFFAGGMAGRSNHECLSRILERLVNNFLETKLYISFETRTLDFDFSFQAFLFGLSNHKYQGQKVTKLLTNMHLMIFSHNMHLDTRY